MARSAFAVFEQAHTPTDDEREALDAALVERITQIVQEDVSIGVYAGVARVTNPRGAAIKIVRAVRRTVQGEPTDAQVLAALNAEAKVIGQLAGYDSGPDTETLDHWHPGNIERTRAILRAAAATQEGENRG